MLLLVHYWNETPALERRLDLWKEVTFHYGVSLAEVERAQTAHEVERNGRDAVVGLAGAASAVHPLDAFWREEQPLLVG